MRSWISEAADKLDRHGVRHLVLDGRSDTAASRHNQGDDRERLAIVMRHNAAALLLNRALFEFQADRFQADRGK